MKIKLRKGDLVEVISGRDKNKRGEIIKVLVEENRVVVQGVNVRKKHQRQTQAAGRTLNPGIIEFEAPIHVSNVMLVCPSCGEPHRVKILRQQDKAVRACKGCNALIDE